VTELVSLPLEKYFLLHVSCRLFLVTLNGLLNSVLVFKPSKQGWWRELSEGSFQWYSALNCLPSLQFLPIWKCLWAGYLEKFPSVFSIQSHGGKQLL